ncbi:MAG: hypothetical protein HOW73_33375 [Polyangiaceae bacterium]|nr:hypothetical protein [Polyangiaceae bacterium]
MRAPRLGFVVLFAVACTGGSPSSESPASSSPPPPATSVAAATVATTAAPAPSEAAPAASSAPVASASASAAPSADVSSEPLPAVTVKNIGIHIGGGPTDEEGMRRTKGPIRRSVEPHFDAFKRCFAKADDQKKGGDVSVDLKIDKAGGKANLTKYRSAIKGEGFEACVKAAYDAIEFEKPADGTTMVSYSLRFTPEKK